MVAGTVVPMRNGHLKSVKLAVIGDNLVIVLFICCHPSETAWILVVLIRTTTCLRHRSMQHVGHRKELSDKLSAGDMVCTHESFESMQPTPEWPSQHKQLPLCQHIHPPQQALSIQLPSVFPTLFNCNHTPPNSTQKSRVVIELFVLFQALPRLTQRRFFFAYARGQRDTSWRAPS